MAEQELIYSTSKALAVEYHFYVTDDIGEIDPFFELLTVLREASPNDYVFIHFNSEGGRLDTCLQLVHAIDSSSATVVGCADGFVCSAASIMFFTCHAFQINKSAQFLLHSGRGGEVGKPADVLAGAEFYHRTIQRVLCTAYENILTEDELEDILKGREMYMTGEEVEERIEQAVAEQEEQEEEEIDKEA